MMTGARIGLSSDGRTALLSRSGRQLRAEVLSPAGARFQVRSAKPPAAAEAQNDEDSVLSLDAAPGDAPADLRLAVLFTPIGDRWPQKPVPEITGIADWH